MVNQRKKRTMKSKNHKGGNYANLPIHYFTNKENMNTTEPNQTNVKYYDDSYGADLAPFSPNDTTTDIQTGGYRKCKKCKKTFKASKFNKKGKKQSGGGLNLRCPNMDCGAPYHPEWSKTEPVPASEQTASAESANEQSGGKRKKQSGGSGRVAMPAQYFDKEMNNYFPEGSTELNPVDSAYGKTVATSHGVSMEGNNKFVGPDLAPFHKTLGVSGIQTGGGNKKSTKQKKNKQKKKSQQNKKSKKQKNKKSKGKR